jgi:putative tricarboxylic transport membrane protein
LRSVLLAASLYAAVLPAGAADWQPAQPLKIIVHTAPGSGADLFARHVAEIIRREKMLAVPVEIVNRGGGGGAVAINFAADKKGDAGWLLCVTNVFLTTPLQQKGLPNYRDFQPVAVLAHDTNAVQVNAASPHKTIHDLIEAARRQPASVSHAFGAFGGTDHIIGYQLAKAAAVQFKYVAFKGGGEATVALLGGHVDFVTGNPGESRAHVEAGKLRVLAIVGEKRLPAFPNVPTLKEQGVNLGSTYAVFRGFVAPPGVASEAVDAYAHVLRRVLDTASWKKYAADNDLVEQFLAPAQMARFLEERNADLAQTLAEMSRTK